MSIKRINQFDEVNQGDLTSDDLLLLMNDPEGAASTKKVSLSSLSSFFGNGGGGGSSFDQDLNTSDFPTFAGVNLPNSANIAPGTYDIGGGGGISLNCTVGYELNWQAGHLKNTYNNGENIAPILCDSTIEFPGIGETYMSVGPEGITFPNGSTQSSAGVVSDTSVASNSATINNIISISQIDYDNLVSKDPGTLYIITG